MRTLSRTILLSAAALAIAAPAHAFRAKAYTNYGTNHQISAGTTQTLASLTLPVGTYTLSANVMTSETDGDGEIGVLACSFVTAGAVHQQSGNVATNPTAMLTVLGDVTVTLDNTAVFLRCAASLHKMGAQGGLIATKVAKIVPSL